MPPKNHGTRWTPDSDAKLEDLAKHNTPTRVIGIKLGRTEDSIRTRAHELDVTLKPVNQSPYNRRK